MSTQGDGIPKDSPEVDTKVLADHGELGDSGLGKRVPKLTEKGKQFSISNVKSLLKRLSKRLDQQITLISPLIDSSNSNIALVTQESANLEQIYTEYSEGFGRFCLLLDEEEDQDEHTAATVSLDEVDSKYFGVKERICSWQLLQDQKLEESRRNASDRGSVASGKSRVSTATRKTCRSQTSKLSSSSSRSERSLQLKAKVAGLKAEAEAIKRTKEAELNAALLKKEEEIMKAEAMEKVYANSLLGKRSARKGAKEVAEDECDDAVGMSNSELQVALMEMMKLQCAPKPDLDIFSGDPLEYCYFKASFREVVETTVPDQRGRLTRLIKYTAGDAKELIKHLVHANPKKCYDMAVELLDKEYGNPHLLSCSYIKELRQWEPIKLNDSVEFKRFYRFLLKCEAYKQQHKLQELDSTDMLRVVILKVPQSLQDKWNRKVLDTRRKHKREVDFSDIVKFLETETTLMSDPAYSRDALTEAGKLLKSNSTQLVEAEGGRRVSWGAICPLCAGTHDFEDCQDFLAKGIDERHKTVFQLKLCFSCLGPIDDEHKGKSCTAKRKCKVCSEDHPTTLHGGKSMTARHTALPYKVISMCVVQVEVWHKDNADNRLTVYALLDECSQGTFIKDDILEKLNVSNLEHTTIRVDTAIGNKEDQAIAVDGLVVGCVPSHATVYGKAEVELPCTYSRPYLAVGVDEIPTPSSVRPWKHLQKVASKLPEYDPSIPIGLMIGSDCPRANEPHKVILSESGGPYAKRLKLGWSVIGPINKHIRDMVIKSNCTSVRRVESVQDVTTGAISDHVFTTSSKVEDTRLTRMLQEMYTSEFNEERSEKIGLSVEDERFLATMEAGIRKNGKHYELPLPFRTKELILPNNRSQGLSRLSSLKRKLQANAEYKSVYDEFMKNLISCYHSRKADTSKDDIGKVWYVPHFGVINPKKEKLRVVFDFSARFQGRCLNEELIQGPNLANLMLGVILRFRREEVAYMADLEAMFYQVQVPDEQRSFLRFLYWPEGKLDEEPVDYEMCVHPFGAVSSGSCANFALKQTAYDGKERYGAEAANVLVREFYVDDHLHSKPDVDSAKVLFRATREMCASGGFNLTKFVSNSKELMEQIPSECLASSLVNIDLSKQHLPIERALGIGWCLEDDSLQYRITLQDKPLNRRGVLATISSVHDPSGLAGPFILPGRVILQKVTGEKGGGMTI